jgi:hypothetical protein
MGGTWLYYIVRKGSIDWSLVRLVAVCLLFLVLVGALQILPAEEYGHLAKRWAGADHELTWNEPVPYTVHREYSLGPLSLLAIVIPGVSRHADPFIGVVALALALLAVALCWRQPAVKLFGAIAIGGLFYSLGANSVFQGFLYAVVPMVDKARVPSMAVIIFNTGIAVLTAFGADQFFRSSDTVWARRVTLGALLFGIVTYTVILNVVYSAGGWQKDDRVALTGLAALLLAALLYAWRTNNLTGRQALTLALLLMLFELGNDAAYAFPHRSEADRRSFFDKVSTNTDIADYIHQQPGNYRAEVLTDALSINWGPYQNIDVLQAMSASVTLNMLELEWHLWQTRYLLGVKYTLSDKPPFGDSREVFTGASGIKLFENPSVFPRAWAVHEILSNRTPADGRALIIDHLDDLRRQAYMQGKAPAVATCSEPDQVAIEQHTGETVTLRANMACDGMVVLSDLYFPGWVAKVDRKSAQIYEVDTALRGVVVPKGLHRVTMRYRPSSVYLGAFLTLLGWCGAIGLVIFGPKTKISIDM